AMLGGEIEQETRITSLQPLLRITTDPTHAPDAPEKVVLAFEKGIPTKLNEEQLPLKTIIEKLTTVGGMHGIGVTYSVKDNIFGLKARAINEEPAADILIFAHRT